MRYLLLVFVAVIPMGAILTAAIDLPVVRATDCIGWLWVKEYQMAIVASVHREFWIAVVGVPTSLGYIACNTERPQRFAFADRAGL